MIDILLDILETEGFATAGQWTRETMEEVRYEQGDIAVKQWITDLEKGICQIIENLPYFIDDDGEYQLSNPDDEIIIDYYYFIVETYWEITNEYER